MITKELLKADLEFTTDRVKEQSGIWERSHLNGRGDSLSRYRRKGT